MQKTEEVEAGKSVSAIIKCTLYPEHFFLVNSARGWRFPHELVKNGENEEAALWRALEKNFDSKNFRLSMRLPYGIAFKGKRVVESTTAFYLLEFEGKIDDAHPPAGVEMKIVPRHALASHLNNAELLATICIMETQGFL